jgi:hypothetical protein
MIAFRILRKLIWRLFKTKKRHFQHCQSIRPKNIRRTGGGGLSHHGMYIRRAPYSRTLHACLPQSKKRLATHREGCPPTKATARQSSLSSTTRAKTGGKGIRTPGLLIANETLYQLSYTPAMAPKLARRQNSSSQRKDCPHSLLEGMDATVTLILDRK